jgi:hypothetical protein
MSKRGEVLCYHGYQLRKSNKTKKQLMVSINEPVYSRNQECLFLFITTDKPKHYNGATPGCNTTKKVFYIPSVNKECLRRDSYIELWVKPIPQSKLLEVGMIHRCLEVVGSLTPDCYNSLIECLKISRGRDIPTMYYDEIFNYKL